MEVLAWSEQGGKGWPQRVIKWCAVRCTQQVLDAMAAAAAATAAATQAAVPMILSSSHPPFSSGTLPPSLSPFPSLAPPPCLSRDPSILYLFPPPPPHTPMVSSALAGCMLSGSTQHSSRAQGLILMTSGGSTPMLRHSTSATAALNRQSESRGRGWAYHARSSSSSR